MIKNEALKADMSNMYFYIPPLHELEKRAPVESLRRLSGRLLSIDKHGAVGHAIRRYPMQNLQYFRYMGQIHWTEGCFITVLHRQDRSIYRRWPLILVCKAWKEIIEDPLNQPDSVSLEDEHMHISCLRALSGKLRSLTLDRWRPDDLRELDLIVTYNCVLTRAATLGVQELEMSFAPPGHWALSMFLWGSLRTLRVNFVGVHQLEEFADSFSGLSRLKDQYLLRLNLIEVHPSNLASLTHSHHNLCGAVHIMRPPIWSQELQLKVSFVDHEAWHCKRRTGLTESDDESDLGNGYHRASRCYAERIIPALQDIEQLCLGPLLQPDFELLLQNIPQYCNLRYLGLWNRESFTWDPYKLNSLKIPPSLSPNLGRLTVLRWPDVDKLEGLASVFDSLEELFIGNYESFEASILKDFKCLRHVHVWRKERFDQLSVWLRSHCPHITCHERTYAWTDIDAWMIPVTW